MYPHDPVSGFMDTFGPVVLLLGFAWLLSEFAHGIRMWIWMGRYGPGVGRRLGVEPGAPLQP
jgi:hypothetical protein